MCEGTARMAATSCELLLRGTVQLFCELRSVKANLMLIARIGEFEHSPRCVEHQLTWLCTRGCHDAASKRPASERLPAVMSARAALGALAHASARLAMADS